MIVTPADHWVVDEEDGFRSIIGECLDLVTGHDALMTVGHPSHTPRNGLRLYTGLGRRGPFVR